VNAMERLELSLFRSFIVSGSPVADGMIGDRVAM
jgi:hypothetical protein